MITKIILIATTRFPELEQWEAFKQQINTIAQEELQITIGEWELREGPGCMNIAFEATGEEDQIGKLGNGLAMAMMPARWTFTDCKPDGGYHYTPILT